MIQSIEEYFNSKLPESYKEFLHHHSQCHQNDVVVLYLAEDVVERNVTYETKTYAPGYINIGDDSGGSAFILKLNEKDPPVNVVGHGSMDPDHMELVSYSFAEWLKNGCPYE